MMPINDRRAAADAGTFNIARYPVRGSFIGLQSYSRVNTPTARTVTIPPGTVPNKPVWLSFLTEHLTQMGAGLLMGMLLTTAAAAQSDAEVQAASDLARVAAQCSFLGAESAKGSAPYNDATRLFSVALPNLMHASAAMVEHLANSPDDTLGVLGPSLKTLPVEFWAGSTFSGWSAEVTKLLDEKAGPYDGSITWDAYWQFRQLQAEIEYGARNCRLIGL
jgi:hypothetical protein